MTKTAVVKKNNISDKIKHFFKEANKYKELYLLMIPGLAVLLIFSYGPMYGLQLAFRNFRIVDGIWGSQWIGLDHFRLMTGHPDFLNAFRNTIIISLNMLLWGFPAPIILALLLNELRNAKFKRITQSVLYLPFFLSWVVMAGIIFALFSSSMGIFNRTLLHMGLETWHIIGNPDAFRPLLYSSAIWKGVGWGTIIYMAAIAGIDQNLYEASYIDGANRFKQCLYITLPSLKYAIIILLILNVGGMMNSNFDQIINLISISTRPTGDVIDTLVFRMGIEDGRFDVATAIGLFRQSINFVLLLTANGIVRLLGEEGFL